MATQSALTCPKLTIETSFSSVSIVNFEKVNADRERDCMVADINYMNLHTYHEYRK